MGREKQAFVQLPETWAADWIIESRLGSGAYSTVYRAVRRDHPGLDAAIKVITIPANESERETLKTEGFNEFQSQQYYDEIARQYIAEIEIMESLKGTQNIVGIEDYKVVRRKDTTGNLIFIRMELLRSLDSVFQQRILTEQEIARLGIDICSALEFCEARQIIHRDIKPANIFINDKTPGHVFYKLGDFGIARNMEALTHGLSTKGTPAYMAPEVFLGKPYDNRADLYSLGITLYRLLNQNRLPFIPENGFSASIREEAMRRRLSGEPLPPPACIGSGISRVVLKACAYHAEDRYRTAAEMRRDLEKVRQELPNPAVRPPADEETVDAPLQSLQVTPTPDIQVIPPHVPDYEEETVILPKAEKDQKRMPVWLRVALILLATAAVCVAVLMIVPHYSIMKEQTETPQPRETVSEAQDEPAETEYLSRTDEEHREDMMPEETVQNTAESREQPEQEEQPEPENKPETDEQRDSEESPEPTEKPETEGEPETEKEETEASSGISDTAEKIILTADHPEVLTHQSVTLSGFAPGARHLRMELFDANTGEPVDRHDADGGVIESVLGWDHATILRAILTATYEDGEETKCSDPVEITVRADGSTGPLTIDCNPAVAEGNPLVGKVYAEQAGWYYLTLDRIDNQHTRLAECNVQPDESGYASFYFAPSLLEKNGVYEISTSANREGKNSTHTSTRIIATGVSNDARPVTLTVDGRTGDVTCLAFQTINVQAYAPGASAMRIFNGNDWEFEYDRVKINRQWLFGRGRQMIIAEASYDNVDWEAVDWNTFDADRDLHWDSVSNPIRVELLAPYGQVDGAEAALETETPARGEILKATLARPSETAGAAYSLWLDRQRENNGEPFWDYVKRIDWDEDHGAVSTLSLEPGHYRLCLETHAAGYDAVTGYTEFDLTEGERRNEPVCYVLRDAQRACEPNVFFCSAEGAERITLQIRRNGDSNYQEDITADGGDGRWDLFLTKTDHYLLTPVIYMPETDQQGNRSADEATGEPLYRELTGETVTITVASDGDLQAPVIASVPAIHPCGEPMKFRFDLPEEAEYCSVTLHRVPDSGDWIMLLFTDGDPADVKARMDTIPADLLSEPGLYRLGIYTNAPGLNDADAGMNFLVVSGEPGKKVSLTLNGSREERVTRRAGEEIPLTIAAPGADAVRLLDGNWNWQYIDKRELNKKGEFSWAPVYNSGLYLVAAQACYDTGIDWDTVDRNTFDWNALDWSETGNAMRIDVTAEGKLQVPAVTVPETIVRGEWTEIEIGDAPGAENYALWIDPLNPEGHQNGPSLVSANFMNSGKHLVPTANLVAGERYGLHVAASARGYDNGDTPYYSIEVTGDEPAAEFRIEPDQVRTGEPFLVSVWAPGAASVKFCHEKPEHVWAEMPSIAGPFTCGEPGDYVFRAYAWFENGKRWQQVGDAITVHVVNADQTENTEK